MGPQADGGGERQLENNKYPQMSQMDTDGGPQADDGGEQQLSSIGQQLKEKIVCQRMTQMDTDGCPQADRGERVLIKDYSHIICFQRCSSSYASF